MPVEKAAGKTGFSSPTRSLGDPEGNLGGHFFCNDIGQLANGTLAFLGK